MEETPMLEYQDKVIQEVSVCTCDRCKKRMTPDDHDSGWPESALDPPPAFPHRRVGDVHFVPPDEPAAI
jgi:hypothetical protein